MTNRFNSQVRGKLVSDPLRTFWRSIDEQLKRGGPASYRSPNDLGSSIPHKMVTKLLMMCVQRPTQENQQAITEYAFCVAKRYNMTLGQVLDYVQGNYDVNAADLPVIYSNILRAFVPSTLKDLQEHFGTRL